MSEKGFTVRLAANVDAYVTAMERARLSTARLSAESIASMSKAGAQMERVGATMTRRVTVPVIAAGAGMVKASIDWESAWAGVAKTVDGSTAELSRLEGQLRAMARSMPATHGQIAAVAEAAGQLGVETESIAGFTDVMVKLGTATNLSADEAATSIAQLMNVMQTAPEDVDNLGAALVELGNNGASTERDIVQMAQRISGAGEIIGLTEAEVLGIANALASVGVEVEAGGSSISTTMAKLARGVDEGGAKLDLFAQTAGMSSEQFSAAFNRDAAGAIVSFVEGLGRIDQAGGNTFEVLDALGMSDIRVSRALLSMANAGTLLRDSIELGNDAWREGAALEEEYGRRAETSASKLRVLWNQIVDVAIDVGDKMVPVLLEVVGGIASMVRWFGELPDPVQNVAVGFLAVTAAAGPLISLTGRVLSNFGVLAKTFQSMTGLAFANPFTAMAAGIGVLALAPSLVDDTRVSQDEMAASSERVAAALGPAVDQVVRLAAESGAAVNPVRFLAQAQEALSTALAAGADDQAEFTGALGALGLTSGDTADVFAAMAPVFDLLRGKVAGTGEDFNRLNENLVGMLEAKGIAPEMARELAGVATSMVSMGDLSDREKERVAGFTAENQALVEAMKIVARTAASTDMASVAADYLNAEVAAGGFKKTLVEQAEAQAGASRNGADAAKVWDAYQVILSRLTPEQLALAAGVGETTAAQAALTPAVDDATGAIEDQAEATERQKAALDRVKDALSDYRNEFEMLADAAGVLEKALDQVSGGAGDMENAQRAFNAGLDEVKESFKENGRSLDLNTEKGRANREMIQEQVDSIVDYGVALVRNGASVEGAANAMDLLTESYVRQLVKAGMNEEAARAFIDTLALTPEDVEVALGLVKNEETKLQLEGRLEQLEGIDEGAAAEIEALIDEGSFDAAMRRLDALEAGREVVLKVRVAGAQRFNPFGGLLPPVEQSAEGRFVPAGANLISTFGEKGPEAILPLDDASRLRALLGDQRISAPIIAALSSGGGGGGGAGGGAVSPWAAMERAASLDDWRPPAPDPTDGMEVLERRYRRGELGREEYDAILAERQVGLERFSDEEQEIHDKRMALQADADRAAEDEIARLADIERARDEALAHERDVMAARYELGEISRDDYEAFLQSQLGSLERHSSDFMAVHRTYWGLQAEEEEAFQKLEEDRLADHLERVERMYEEAIANRAANEAAAEADESMAALSGAATKAALFQLDRNRTAEERAEANAELELAKAAAAEALFRRADALANKAGVEDGTVEWAAMVRSALEGDAANAPALAHYIQAILVGIPQFASGGLVNPSAGGTVVRVAEAWKREMIAPVDEFDRELRRMLSGVLVSAGAYAGGGGRGDVSIGDTHVRVFVGNTEIRDIARVEIHRDNAARALELNAVRL